MQIAIIQTDAADFVKIYICVILKTFGYDCTVTAGTTSSMHLLMKPVTGLLLNAIGRILEHIPICASKTVL
jgi:hypothetical protein